MLGCGFDVGVVEGAEPVGVDRGDEREDAAHEVGAAGRDVFVGGGEQRPDRERDGVVERHALGPAGLDPVAGVHAARTLALVVLLLVATAGDVVGEDAAAFAVLVVAGEQRHDREALHRGGQVGAHEHAELVGLAFEAQHLALHLLVVLELGLEELHHLDRGPGRAGDRDAGEVVGREHLVDAAVGDRVARGRPAVAGHHHAVGVADRDDRGAVRDVERRRPLPAPAPGSWCGLTWRRSSANDGPGSVCEANSGNELGSDIERGAYRRTSGAQRNHPLPRERQRARRPGRGTPSRPRARSSSSSNWPIAMLQFEAEDAAHATGLVVVVDVVGVGLAADRAAATLRSEELVELLEREPVLPLEVTLAIRDLLLAGVRVVLAHVAARTARDSRAATCSTRSMYGRGFSRYFAATRARLHALHSGRRPSRPPCARVEVVERL